MSAIAAGASDALVYVAFFAKAGVLVAVVDRVAVWRGWW